MGAQKMVNGLIGGDEWQAMGEFETFLGKRALLS